MPVHGLNLSQGMISFTKLGQSLASLLCDKLAAEKKLMVDEVIVKFKGCSSTSLGN